MLTPDAIAALADLGFSFDANEPCPRRYIVGDIESARWASSADRDEVESVITRALAVVFDGGWIPASPELETIRLARVAFM